MENLSFAIITPSIGLPALEDCIESVKKQSYNNFIHHIFVDGKQYFEPIQNIILKHGHENIRTNILEDNIGKGWYGHRVYAASSFLVNQDVIIYLDEDNWLEPDHLMNYIDLFNKDSSLQWAYSLRKIFDSERNFICEDNCESLGKWATFHNNEIFHIDTSCYAIKKQTALSIGHAWYGQWGADRQFFSAIKQYFPNFSCTKKHSLCYRLGGNEGSVQKNFFLEGNKVHENKYGKEFPWLKKEALEHVIGPGIRIQV